MHAPESPERIDAVLDAVGDRQRRYALYYVRQRDEVTIDELATALTGWLALGGGDGTADRGDHERVRASLHHRDLPKLTDARLVSVDRSTDEVAYDGDPFADDLLDLLFERESLSERAPSGEATDPEV